jgi:hypothetical protein
MDTFHSILAVMDRVVFAQRRGISPALVMQEIRVQAEELAQVLLGKKPQAPATGGAWIQSPEI